MLLDTHVVLWLVSDPDKLGARCRQAIRNATGVQQAAETWAALGP